MLDNKTYDVLKWLVLIAIPAVAACYASLAGIWGWPYPDEVTKTANYVCAMLGILLGISTVKYNRQD